MSAPGPHPSSSADRLDRWSVAGLDGARLQSRRALAKRRFAIGPAANTIAGADPRSDAFYAATGKYQLPSTADAQAVTCSIAIAPDARSHPHPRGFLHWRLSDDGPSARGRVRGGPSSETLHTSRRVKLQ